MQYTFDTAEWKSIIEEALSSTRSDDLIWEVDDDWDNNPNALRFRAKSGLTNFFMFGRLRGFSYQLSVSREVEGHPVVGVPIKVTNKKAADGIPFDLLFRAIRDQVVRNEIAAERLAAVEAMALILENIDHGRPLGEDDFDSLEPEFSDEQWDSLIGRLISATEAGSIIWSSSNPAEGWIYEAEKSGMQYSIGREANPDHGYFFTITCSATDFWSDTRQWDESSLEALAEAIGIPTPNTEAKFEAIAKASVLDDILKDISPTA